MRSSKSRSRNKSNNRNRSVGNIVNRVFDSSGPEGKVRGTPQQIIEKYNQLARDAQLAGDRVATENFQQHAEHYTRMLAEAQREQEARREQQEAQQQQRREKQDKQQRNDDRQSDDQHKGKDASQSNDDKSHAKPDPRPENEVAGTGEQPDVIDLEAEKDRSALVDTPENAPKKPRRPRRKKTDEAPAEAPTSGDAPEAAE